MLDGMSRPSI